ncbi:MAG: hypothetical protein AAF636_12640 [Pseudomonadota bacterium]
MMAVMPNNQTGASKAPDLAHILRRLSAGPEDLARERRVLPTGARDRLEVVLREINETVLPRAITVKCSGTALATLFVANRRVFHLQPAAGVLPGVSENSMDTAVIAQQLLDISKSATSIGIETIDRRDHAFTTNQSFSVSALRIALGLDCQDTGASSLDDLLKQHAIAGMRWRAGSKELQFVGAQIWRETMQSHAARMLKIPTSPLLASRSTRSNAVGLAVPLTQALLLVLARDDEGGFACVVPCEKGFEALGTWQMLAS